MNEKVYDAAMGLLRLSFFKKEKSISKTKKSEMQTTVLQAIFNLTSHPSGFTQIDLAILLNMQIKSMKIWFQNAQQQKKKKMIESGRLDYDELINDDLINVPVSFIIKEINEYNGKKLA